MVSINRQLSYIRECRVSYKLFCQSHNKESCPCCTREFTDLSEYKAFQNRMAELADEDTSELIRVNQAKSKETAVLLSKLEVSSNLILNLLFH